MKKAERSRSNKDVAAAKAARFVVEKRGSRVFINGYPILRPRGRTSVSRSELRKAVRAAVRDAG